jgi:hypothetical protein
VLEGLVGFEFKVKGRIPLRVGQEIVQLSLEGEASCAERFVCVQMILHLPEP